VFTTYSTHNAGVYQQVQVPAGSKLTFSAWVQIWSSQHHDPDTVRDPGDYRAYVGIDPTGGTDWNSTNVVWSEPRIEYNNSIRLEVQAEAQASTITVFLRGHPEFRVKFNDSYWDDACLMVVRPTPRPTKTPIDTPTPMPSPTPTVSPVPTSTPTPAPGEVCFSVYIDLDNNGRRDDGEDLAAGVVISLLGDQHQKLEEYTTDGVNEPFCFSGLEPGAYYLKQQNPPIYQAPVLEDLGVIVEPGKSTQVELDAWPLPTPSATPTATGTATPTATPTPESVLRVIGAATHSVSGILVAALALVLLLSLRYLRERL
jgi:hypothetical protein